jgi:hypothetical protein
MISCMERGATDQNSVPCEVCRDNLKNRLSWSSLEKCSPGGGYQNLERPRLRMASKSSLMQREFVDSLIL